MGQLFVLSEVEHFERPHFLVLVLNFCRGLGKACRRRGLGLCGGCEHFL